MNLKMNIGDYTSELIGAGSTLAAAVMAYKQGLKNAKSTHLDNVEKAIKIWEDTANKLESKLNNMESEMEVIRKNHEDCENSKKKLEEKVKCLDEKVCNLEDVNKEMKTALHNVIGTPKEIRK